MGGSPTALIKKSPSGNRLTKIEGLDSLVNLEELYLSHNGLTRIEGLRNLVRPPAPSSSSCSNGGVISVC